MPKLNEYKKILDILGLKKTISIIFEKIFSINHYYILTFNTKKVDFPVSQRDRMTIRPARQYDFDEIMKKLQYLDPESRKELVARLLFYQEGFGRCYIALNANTEIAAIQWLVYPEENHLIEKKHKYRFYPLRSSQFMVENIFIFPHMRGIGVLPFITTELLRKAQKDGYKTAIAYIRKDKTAALNEFMSIGFKIRKIIPEFKFCGFVIRKL